MPYKASSLDERIRSCHLFARYPSWTGAMNLSFLKHPAVQIVEAVARGPRETQASPRRRNHPKTKRINWNDGADALVEITGIGFFDRPHGQIGRAPNNFEIHPILAIRFLDQPTPSTSPTPTPSPRPSPSGNQWEYQMISAANATDLLNQANTQGTQGWELSGVAVDTSRPDKYVGFLKRKKQ
jgi:hypothetical protein